MNSPSDDDLMPDMAVPMEVRPTSIIRAEAIQWAIENINRKKVTEVSAGSALKYTFWKFGQEDEIARRTLIVTLGNWAEAVLDKASGAGMDEITASEEAAVKDLDAFIEAAIQEATG